MKKVEKELDNLKVSKNMLTGLQGGGTTRMGFEFCIITFLSLCYCGIYAVWSGNNLALIVDNPETDRYVTLDFWRLVFPLLVIGAPFTSLLLLYNDLSLNGFYPYGFHLITIVACIIISGTWIGWFVIDVISCTSVVYCIGNGTGPFGVDVAFFTAAIAQGLMIILDFIFLFFNFYMKHKVQVYHMIDATAFPNRQPSTANLMGSSIVRTSYIGNSMSNNNKSD